MYLSMHDVMISLGACARRMSFAEGLVFVVVLLYVFWDVTSIVIKREARSDE